LNVANFLDISDPGAFPRAFLEGTIGGDYAPQHTSDLVRLPLLLKYGGVYADVGLMQIGDLNRLWRETVGNPNSRFEIIAYSVSGVEGRFLMNYFFASGRNNPLFERCHTFFLELWTENGGRTSTEGMHSSPVLKGIPLVGGSLTIKEEGKEIGAEKSNRIWTDYAVQMQVMSLVMRLVDEEGGWDGPKYVAEHVYGIDSLVGSMLINDVTEWDEKKAFDPMSLSLPKDGEAESAEQKQAREIVEGCLQKSFGVKLAHGLVLRVFGETLRLLWRKHEGSDDVPGTYAHWLKHGMMYWNPDGMPPALNFKVIEPSTKGPLLREE